MATITEKNQKDLAKELSEKREELRKFRFGMSGSATRDTKRGRNLRKDISRILTELRRREIVDAA